MAQPFSKVTVVTVTLGQKKPVITCQGEIDNEKSNEHFV